MHQTKSTSMKSTDLTQAIHYVVAAALAVATLIGHLAACDVCLRAPRIPFAVDHPAAIEVAMATCEAAEQGWLERNPVIKRTLATDRLTPPRLSEISARQLVKLWLQTQPAKQNRGLRVTVDVVFIETDSICHLDVRMGNVLEDASQSGSADVRILTTKSGFYRILMSGFKACEYRKLVAMDADETEYRDVLVKLFSSMQAEAPDSLASSQGD